MPVEFRRLAAAVRVEGKLVPIEAGEPVEAPVPPPPAAAPQEEPPD